ncbi:MAG: hypothetical protein RL358_334 [Pseudomonadota bacterium]
MKKILLLVCMTFLMSGCLYSPYDFDGRDGSHAGRGHGDGGEHGHGDGERRGRGD